METPSLSLSRPPGPPVFGLSCGGHSTIWYIIINCSIGRGSDVGPRRATFYSSDRPFCPFFFVHPECANPAEHGHLETFLSSLFPPRRLPTDSLVMISGVQRPVAATTDLFTGSKGVFLDTCHLGSGKRKFGNRAKLRWPETCLALSYLPNTFRYACRETADRGKRDSHAASGQGFVFCSLFLSSVFSRIIGRFLLEQHSANASPQMRTRRG